MWKRVKDLVWPTNTSEKHIAGVIFRHKLIPLTVILSKAVMENGEEWKHVSISRKDRLPSWVEVSKAKLDFIGAEKEAFHVIPKESDYRHLHFFCIHLWSPMKSKMEFPNLQKIEQEIPL